MSNFMIPNNARNSWTTRILVFQSTIGWENETYMFCQKSFLLYFMFPFHRAHIFQKFSIRRYLFNGVQQKNVDLWCGILMWNLEINVNITSFSSCYIDAEAQTGGFKVYGTLTHRKEMTKNIERRRWRWRWRMTKNEYGGF